MITMIGWYTLPDKDCFMVSLPALPPVMQDLEGPYVSFNSDSTLSGPPWTAISYGGCV